MLFGKTKNIEKVWGNICKHEGEAFYTVRNKEYDYVVKDDCILVKNDSRKRITKADFEKALSIHNPTWSKIESEGIWGPSYVLGIITDKRIISF